MLAHGFCLPNLTYGQDLHAMVNFLLSKPEYVDLHNKFNVAGDTFVHVRLWQLLMLVH